MKKDIVVTIAKRTMTEVKEQLSEVPFIAQCWAIMGLLLVSWGVMFLCVVLQLFFIAYEQYKEVLSEIEDGTEEFETQKKVNTSVPEEEKKEQ
ncbi:hypothetical protein GAP32_528 [Cronobacter phage vB_CsaM_GAP32]|uniref:Putative membrane protein n=1 Tax=Cronobacter phage vB_CsaM_GAP32 TaxID=1141136 RepID=K4FBA2_9CAUD|nr:hypothetical protein GAP32_528 [Cronobacter phage vB_CsaM_GAP32]AFC21989.1 putative membrane protein [Cronobacter phage vB_CsaM_GAP32]